MFQSYDNIPIDHIFLESIFIDIYGNSSSMISKPNGFELTEIPRSLGGEVPCSLGEAARD